MVTRLLLSLRKAVTLQEDGWSLKEPTTYTMRFAEDGGFRGTKDEIPLDTFASTSEGAQSRA
jgi:hypothetical protein